jgi:hypothetical protein
VVKAQREKVCRGECKRQSEVQAAETVRVKRAERREGVEARVSAEPRHEISANEASCPRMGVTGRCMAKGCGVGSEHANEGQIRRGEEEKTARVGEERQSCVKTRAVVGTQERRGDKNEASRAREGNW